MLDQESTHYLLNNNNDDQDLACDSTSEKPYWSRRHKTSISKVAILLFLLTASNFVQGLIILQFIRTTRQDRTESKTTYSDFAHLEESSVQVNWSQDSVYTSSNTSEADKAWDMINHDSGIVAVSKEWAANKGLPMGSTFPWDDSKAIYFVNAYHGLHCLKNIYRSVMEYREGKPQSLEYHHISHCLDQLRADVLCTADDTLRVTTPDMRPVTAEGQYRTCRSWDALQQWTLDHQGCYRYGDPNVEDVKESQIPRMRYCQEGTQDLDRVRQYFNKGAEWKPAEEKVWSWFDGSGADVKTRSFRS